MGGQSCKNWPIFRWLYSENGRSYKDDDDSIEFLDVDLP